MLKNLTILLGLLAASCSKDLAPTANSGKELDWSDFIRPDEYIVDKSYSVAVISFSDCQGQQHSIHLEDSLRVVIDAPPATSQSSHFVIQLKVKTGDYEELVAITTTVIDLYSHFATAPLFFTEQKPTMLNRLLEGCSCDDSLAVRVRIAPDKHLLWVGGVSKYCPKDSLNQK